MTWLKIILIPKYQGETWGEILLTLRLWKYSIGSRHRNNLKFNILVFDNDIFITIQFKILFWLGTYNCYFKLYS